ncbi:hypothetical protein TNCV_3369561 [Trichonephila clavipes]|uniref:Uncharacterized protein n=1 Tax=Trichonephila clavipes TaxID=2585209 RepID=A0A8X6RD19_TRICX|nr:hypothetical protein TNCV_3369561 [Trichonephila clavipes]
MGLFAARPVDARTVRREPPSQYGGYEPRHVTERVHVQIPSKAWLYLIREKSGFRLYWIPVSDEKQRTPSVVCWDHHVY